MQQVDTASSSVPCCRADAIPALSALTFCTSVLFVVTAPGPAAASSAAGDAALLVPPAASHDSQMPTASETVLLHDALTARQYNVASRVGA
jgi:hypothetical protein